MRALIVASLLLGWSGQGAAQSCPTPEGWAKPARHVSARLPRFRFALEPNNSAQLDLHVQRSVVLATKEGKPGWMDRFSGLAALDVKQAGKLDVALSSQARVDLVRDGRTLDFADHRRVSCNGIFKVVTFDVEPGRHIVQIANSQARTIRVGTIQR